jgi:hypothetical protein
LKAALDLKSSLTRGGDGGDADYGEQVSRLHRATRRNYFKRQNMRSMALRRRNGEKQFFHLQLALGGMLAIASRSSRYYRRAICSLPCGAHQGERTTSERGFSSCGRGANDGWPDFSPPFRLPPSDGFDGGGATNQNLVWAFRRPARAHGTDRSILLSQPSAHSDRRAISSAHVRTGVDPTPPGFQQMNDAADHPPASSRASRANRPASGVGKVSR